MSAPGPGTHGLARREFLKASAAGAGLVLGFYIAPRAVLAQFQLENPGNMPPNAFVRISPDNIITVISKHTEMGQGVYTGLATLLAEEMDADWSQVRVESAPVDMKFYRHLMLGMQGTGGSSSMRNSWQQYRTVGATARAMLVSAAAREWDVPEAEITVTRGIVSHASGKHATFGELSGKAAAVTPPSDVKLKQRGDYSLIGADLPRVDTREKTNGTARYTIDVQRPNMLTALVARAPRFGGRVKSFDDRAARKIKGVVDVVEIPRGVVVLAANTWTAMRGRDALQVEWDESAAERRGSEEIIRDFFKLAEQPGAPYEMKGDAAGALAGAAQSFSADYIFPFLAHATMEPVDCSIEMTGDRCLIRSGTQMPSIERDWVAELLGLAPEMVQVENLFAGGGFGRRGNFVPDLASEAASIVKASGGKYPIKLQYTRADDMRAGFYRPLFVHRMRGALDAQGNISAWTNRVVGQSFVEGTFFGGMIRNGIDPIAVEGSAHLPYAIPNVAVDFHLARTGVPTLAWRSVGHTHTAYSKETFLDELLHASGKDPVAGRLALMSDERSKAVLQLAAVKAGWSNILPKGRARGAAFVESFGSRVAQIAEVSKDGKGRVRVEKVVCAVDCGTAINPNIVRDQIESAIGFGLTAALYGEVRIEDGMVKTGNFDTYPLLRINEMPQVEVHIVPSTADPTGIGEPGTPPIAPAVANAWFRLTGERIRRLPFNRA